jgi:hypothetical protein
VNLLLVFESGELEFLLKIEEENSCFFIFMTGMFLVDFFKLMFVRVKGLRNLTDFSFLAEFLVDDTCLGDCSTIAEFLFFVSGFAWLKEFVRTFFLFPFNIKL